MKTIKQINKRKEAYYKKLARTISVHEFIADVARTGDYYVSALRRKVEKLVYSIDNFSCKLRNRTISFTKTHAGYMIAYFQDSHKEFLMKETIAREIAADQFETVASRLKKEAEELKEAYKNA